MTIKHYNFVKKFNKQNTDNGENTQPQIIPWDHGDLII